MIKLLQLFILALLLTLPLQTQAAEYQINPARSNISFKVTHFGKGKVKGQFRLFSGSLDYEANNLKNAKTQAQIQASSIYTGISSRDEHLRSSRFLDIKKYPQIEFVSTEIKEKDEKEFIVLGKLTIREITKPVELKTKLVKVSPDKKTVLFAANTTLKRKDYGLLWNTLLESGHVVGENIEVFLEIEGTCK